MTTEITTEIHTGSKIPQSSYGATGSQKHPNESSYTIATVIDRGLYDIYNSPIYRRLYKSSKFVYNIRKSD